MIIREATVNDIDNYMVVRMAVNENMLSNPALVTRKDNEDYLTLHGKGWVCETGNQIVGFSIVGLTQHNIWALFVHPDFEGRGIGRKLHDSMLDWYFAQTNESVWLGTSPDTRAEKFYRKSGWKEIGVHGKGEIKFEMDFNQWKLMKGNLKFYHGTKGNLKPGELIEPGFNSNYGKGRKASFVYLTATLDAATWGAELALGEEPGRIYIVEPTGLIEDDPNLTDKKYPGNPTKSYRSRNALRVTGEVTDWKGHTPEQIKVMKDNLERLKQLGIEAIED